jgi:hypothetical protein
LNDQDQLPSPYLDFVINEIGVLDLRPKLLGFHMPGLATCPCMPIRRHGKVEKGDLLHSPETCPGKRQSKHSAHLQLSPGYRHELYV